MSTLCTKAPRKRVLIVEVHSHGGGRMKRFALLVGVFLLTGVAVRGQTPVRSSLFSKDTLRVSVEPRFASPSDEVTVTVSGTYFLDLSARFDRAEIQIQGNVIHLDLHWCYPTNMLTDWTSREYSYERTITLGTFGPGSYTVKAANHGVVGGTGTTSFMVRPQSTSPWGIFRDDCFCDRHPDLFVGKTCPLCGRYVPNPLTSVGPRPSEVVQLLD
jgi:hypothetical protein